MAKCKTALIDVSQQSQYTSTSESVKMRPRKKCVLNVPPPQVDVKTISHLNPRPQPQPPAPEQFLKGLGLWFLLAIPSTYTNSLLRHFQSKLSLSLRTRLTRYTHDLYLSSAPDHRYYRSGLEGVDQYITSDVEAWSEALSGQ